LLAKNAIRVIVGTVVATVTAPRTGLVAKIRAIVARREQAMSTLKNRQANKKSCSRQTSAVEREISSPVFTRS
jgi:hypothetical protein